jgi:hypothetical protein
MSIFKSHEKDLLDLRFSKQIREYIERYIERKKDHVLGCNSYISIDIHQHSRGMYFTIFWVEK